MCVCARARERACISIQPLIEKSSYRIREGTWALPLGVMCETIRFDVWDAIDGQTPPSMREYLLKKKKRAVSVEAERTAAAAVADEASGAGKHLRDTSTGSGSRRRLCATVSAYNLEGTAYQGQSPIHSRPGTPGVAAAGGSGGGLRFTPLFSFK